MNNKDKAFIANLEKVKEKYKTWVLGSIEVTYEATRESKNNSTPLAAFILLSCAIDFIAGFYSGLSNFDSRNSGEIYKKFIRKYMTKYDPADIYVGIRCRLAHNYTLGEDIALTHQQPKLHKPKVKAGEKKVINFENIYSDFKNAVEQYFQELEKSEANMDVQKKFIKRYKLGFADVV